jgi:hypothetical protein
MEKNCLYCEGPFTASRSTKKYCSDNCKQMAYFKRNGLVLSGGMVQGGQTASVKSQVREIAPAVKYDTPENAQVRNVLTVKEPEQAKRQEPIPDFTVSEMALNNFSQQLLLMVEHKIEQQMNSVKKELDVKYGSGEQNTVRSQAIEHPTVKTESPSKEANVKYDSLVENTVSDKTEEGEIMHFTVKDKQTEQLVRKEEAPAVSKPIFPIELLDEDPSNPESPEEEEDLEFEEQESGETPNTEEMKNEKPELKEKFEGEKGEEDDDFSAFKKNEQKVSEVMPEEEAEYWPVESDFLRRVRKHQLELHRFKKFDNPVAFWNIDSIVRNQWVSKRFRTLAESLVKLSNYGSVDRQTLFAVTDAFNRMIKTNQFQKLPADYPYAGLIRELSEKLNGLSREHRNTEQIRFRLSMDRKALLVAIRNFLSRHTEKLKFSELTFADEKEFLIPLLAK